jgi:hypothetical protein
MSAMTRSLLILPAVAAALALGACGSSDDDGGGSANGSPASASRQDKAFEGALKYAKCMRDHGIDMPDPQRVGTGGIKVTGGKGINPNDPKTKAAQKDCEKYMKVGGGERLDPQRRAQLQEAALKFARCMRQNGVDMPDPQFSADGGVTMRFQGAAKPSSGSGPDQGPNPDSPKFKAAQEKCQGLLGNVEGPSVSSERDG